MKMALFSKAFFSALPLVFLALAFTATPALAKDPIVIGWVGPLSPPGNYAAGQETKWATELEVDQINDAGGVLGRPLKVIFEDTKGQPAEGSSAANLLVTKDKVSAIIGEFHSSVALAEIGVAHKYHVPFVGTDVWSDKITAKQYPEVFRISPANSLIYQKAAEWVGSHFHNVAIIAEDTDFGQGGAKILADEYKANGVPYSLVSIDLNQQDFTPALLRIMHQDPKPDILQMVVAGQAQYKIVKQACQLGIAPTAKTALIGSSGLLQKEVWEVDGKCAKNLLIVNVARPKNQWNDKAKSFMAAFKKRYDRDPTGIAMEAYDTLGVVVAAIKKADSAEPKDITAALEDIKWEGTNATYTFSKKKEPDWAFHQFMDVPFTIIQYTEMNQTPQDAAILYPKKWATADTIQPAK